MSVFYQRARFLLGVARLNQLPPDTGIEVAFAGRSNVGKSSALNVITRQRSLARTSKTPGRTQQINFFVIDDTRRLVDLPGYGYAKVPENVKKHWQHLLSRYLERRQCLNGLVVLMDVRHPLTDYDTQMLAWCAAADVPVHVLLTKADKLSRGAALHTLQSVRAGMKDFVGESGCIPGVQLFSSLKRYGVEEAEQTLDRWFGLDKEQCG